MGTDKDVNWLHQNIIPEGCKDWWGTTTSGPNSRCTDWPVVVDNKQKVAVVINLQLQFQVTATSRRGMRSWRSASANFLWKANCPSNDRNTWTCGSYAGRVAPQCTNTLNSHVSGRGPMFCRKYGLYSMIIPFYLYDLVMSSFAFNFNSPLKEW